jgi:Secretion system C-terminal sorting domain/Beta-propeller repeat
LSLHHAAQFGDGDQEIPAIIQKSGFIENKGQIKDQFGNPNLEALFILPTAGNTVFLKSNGFSYDTYIDEFESNLNPNTDLILPGSQEPASFTRHYHRVDIHFEGCNPDIEIERYSPLAGELNFYTSGTGEFGVTNVKTYSRILYKNVYPNIDIEFISQDTPEVHFEYNFILYPGADINDISLQYAGMNDFKMQDGELIITLSHGQLKEKIPASFSHIDNGKIDIQYSLKSVQTFNDFFEKSQDQFQNSKNQINRCFATVSFTGLNVPVETGVTIDPTPLLLWATYYGGTGSDYGYGITKDLNGFVLTCGATASNSLIATAGSQQSTIGSSSVQDSFILKLDDLGIRQWCTYYGGTGLDYGRSLVCDISGNVYVAGDSESSSSISTAGSHQNIFGGIRDAYLLKLDAAGVRQWSTYYGGSAQEFAGDICLDGAGNLIFVGNSGSSSSIATAGSFQNALGGSTDGFLAKFNASGTRLWGTFVGGVLTDAINAAAVDLSNNIYVVGNTVSVAGISTLGSFQAAALGNNDAFLIKFSSAGSRLWGTYYGGAGNDIGSGVTCDISDYPCISGYTQSTSGLSTAGAHQVNFGGGNYDGFVARFNTTGARQWGTFFGGSLDDLLWNIYADDCGNMYTVGQTQSTSGIATSDTHQGVHGGLSDFYVSKFEETGILIWSTYYGGTGQEYGRSLCLDQSLDIYVIGQAASAGLSTAGAQQPNHGGAGDALIFKLYTYSALPIDLVSFEAVPYTDKRVLTTWATSSELNNALFTVERSSDGIHFQVVGTLPGAGNSQFYRNYEFEDKNPLNGTSYYRLKQTDFNGQFTYSNLAVVQISASQSLNIYPNPSSGNFRIWSAEDGILEIITASGQKVDEIKIISGLNEINRTQLPPGIYLCNLIGQGEPIHSKLVIEKK